MKKYLVSIIIIGAILLAGLLTHFISQWSTDKSQEEAKRIENLLTNQKDSLNNIFYADKLAFLNAAEQKRLNDVNKLSTENKSLKNRLKIAISELPDTMVIGCEKNEDVIVSQDSLINQLDQEAQEYSLL